MAEETTVEQPPLLDDGSVDLTAGMQALEQQFFDEELERAMGDASEGQDAPQGEEQTADDAGDVPKADESADNVPAEADAPADVPDGPRPGIDSALSFLDEHNPDLAGIVRAQIRDNDVLRGRNKEIEGGIESAVSEAVAQAMSELQPTTITEQQVNGGAQYSADEVEQAKAVLKQELGVVFKEDLDAEERQNTLQNYLDTAAAEAVEKYGEVFGKKDANGVVMSEGTQQRVNDEWSRISQHGTVTTKDLFVLSHHDEMVKQAYEKGRAEGQKVLNGRANRLNSASTANTSAPVSSSLQIRGEKGTEDDSLQAVTRRAFLAAREKLGLS